MKASLASCGRFEIMKLHFTTVDVFTDRQFGGNPLAVRVGNMVVALRRDMARLIEVEP